MNTTIPRARLTNTIHDGLRRGDQVMPLRPDALEISRIECHQTRHTRLLSGPRDQGVAARRRSLAVRWRRTTATRSAVATPENTSTPPFTVSGVLRSSGRRCNSPLHRSTASRVPGRKWSASRTRFGIKTRPSCSRVARMGSFCHAPGASQQPRPPRLRRRGRTRRSPLGCRARRRSASPGRWRPSREPHASFLTQVDDRLTERLTGWLGRRHGLQPFRSDGRAANTHCGESLRDQLPKEAFVHELQLVKPYRPDRIMRLDGVCTVSNGHLSLAAPYRPRLGASMASAGAGELG